MNIIIIGKPGSGKGTQAHLLQKHNHFVPISTGNLIRQEIEAKTELGVAIKKRMDDGYYLDDDKVFALLMPELSQEQNLVFDGFPRTIPQAQKIDTLIPIDLVIELDISDKAVVSRISNRCMVNLDGTQHSFSSKESAQEFLNKKGGRLFQRPEDRAEIVQKRLDIYAKQTAPICKHYKNQNTLVQINAAKSIEDIHRQITSLLANI